MRVGRLLLTCLLALVFVIPVQAGEMMWTKEFDKDIKYKKLTAAGVYLVLTDNGLFGLDPETGNELWSYTEEKLKPDDFEYVEGTPLLLITKGKGFANRTVNMSVISIMDGHETWKLEGIPGIVVGSQIVFEHGLVVLYTMGGKDGIAVNAYDAIDGTHKFQVAFPKKQELKKVNMIRPPGAGTFSTKIKIIGHQEPIVDGDHMIVFYDFLRKIDMTTGQQVWMDTSEKKRPKEKDVPMLSSNYAPMQLRGGVIYTPYGKGLAAFDAATGQRKWLVEKVKGEMVTAMRFEGDKLYYRSGGVMKGAGKKAKMVDAIYNGVNMADGSMLWEKDVKLKGGGTNWAFADDKIYVAQGERLYTFDKATGSKGKPQKSDGKFKFKDGSPHSISYDNGKLLVQGGQTVAMYDISGGDIDKELWRQYYKSPGAFGMFTKLAIGAISAMSYMDASARASRSYSGSFSNRIANDQRKSAWGTFNRVMNERVQATASSDKYQYVLTKLDDGEGLVGVNLKTGAADREILLKEKKPDYEMDEAAGILFFQKKKKLSAFKLEG